MTRMRSGSVGCALVLAGLVWIGSREAAGQETPLDWDATRYFRYDVENVVLDTSATPWKAKVIFSVANPNPSPEAPNLLWDIKGDVPFTFKPPAPVPGQAPPPSPSLTIDIGWSTLEYVNTGSRLDLNPVPFGQGVGAALPIRVNALAGASPCASTVDCPGVPDIALRFWVAASLPPPVIDTVATGFAGTAAVGVEGHPVWPTSAPVANVPVTSAVEYFPITDTIPVARRQVVDLAKCKGCHDGNHPGIPRLSLHGGNRTEQLRLCVICHNPNQTDVPYRTPLSPPSPDPLLANRQLIRAPEASVDFKRLIHGIHSGGFRRNAYMIVGFRGTVADFSQVRFPGELRNCLNCHVEANGKGTFELPLAATVLGSTVKTGSDVGVFVDLDPTNNLRITPIASVCSSCHDKREVLQHMLSRGASFGVLATDARYGQERCASCHGPGKSMDVRKVHEVGHVEDDD